MFQDIIRPLSNPIKETGHIQILRGDLAPDGSVAKITGKEGLYFSGNVGSLLCLLYTPYLANASQLYGLYNGTIYFRSCACI